MSMPSDPLSPSGQRARRAVRAAAAGLLAVLLAGPPAAGTDVGFQAWPSSSVAPAAFDHALGPGHVVATRRLGEIRYFTRDGALTYEGTTPLGEQRVTFDPYSRRFLLAGFGGDCGGVHCLTLSASDDADPHGGWISASVDIGLLLGPNYPGHSNYLALGLDEEHVILAWDTLPPDPSARRSYALVFDRDSFLAGQGAVFNAFETHFVSVSYAPARTFGPAPAQYLVTTYGEPVGTWRLTFLALRDPLGSPVLDRFVLDVPPFEYGPLSIPSQDVPAGIDSTGSGVLRAVYRDGSLWLTHHGRPHTESRALGIWYEVATNGWPLSGQVPQLVQTGVIDPGPGIHTWIPDLAVDAAGTVFFAYLRSAADQVPAVARAHRHVADPPGTLQGHAVLYASDLVEGLPVPAHHATGSSTAEDPDVSGHFSAGGAYRRENEFGGLSLAMWVATPPVLPLFADGFESGDTGAWGP